ncbi:ArnT family glycosyltransferase [Brevundimonas poindexterae]|uniref:ArnT family glycosyltransferase n=1 Tax=Brevundimonas poindexterae TaxID=74325 RepID=UPI001CFD6C44|nr:glycosyltransferase family 39 protein [Brevundimonas poindexterae]
MRLIGLWTARTDLYVDEAQYWAWSQNLAWGYFSKPPFLAWMIAAAEPLCGSTEACVRAPSTLSWAITALAVSATAATLGGRRAAWWAGLGVLLAPGAAFSARIASTDAPLLMFWALAVLAFLRLRAGSGRGWLALMAVSFGLGLLSKYAMAYLLPCLAIAALVDADSRRTLRRPDVWLALAAGLFIFSPNLAWNALNGAVTLQHTADNARGEGLALDVGSGLEFIAAQFLLAGPVALAAVAMEAARGSTLRPDERLLLALSLPVLLALTVLAFMGRAHANWAATALIAVWVLSGLLFARQRLPLWPVGLLLGVALQALLLVGDAWPDRVGVSGSEPYRQVRGWSDLSRAVARQAREQGVSTVIAETRADAAQLTYYLRNSPLQVRVWPTPEGQGPANYYEMTRALDAADAGRPALLATACPDMDRLPAARRLAPVTVRTGRIGRRTRHLFVVTGGAASRPAPCTSGPAPTPDAP